MKDSKELNLNELNKVSGGDGYTYVDWDAVIARLTDLCPLCNHCMPLNKSIIVMDANEERLIFETRCCGKGGRLFPSGEIRF